METFRYRQSSAIGPGGRNRFWNGSVCCGQLGANWVASRTPFQSVAGRGARHRRSPGGGSGVRQPAEGVAAGHGDAAHGAALDRDDRGADGACSRGGYVGFGSGSARRREDQRGQGRAEGGQRGTP